MLISILVGGQFGGSSPKKVFDLTILVDPAPAGLAIVVVAGFLTYFFGSPAKVC